MKHISIEQVKDNLIEYNIKDEVGINLGQIYVLQVSRKNKSLMINIKIYKKRECYAILRAILIKVNNSCFNIENFNKLNILVEEESPIEVFEELGFKIEGILRGTITTEDTLKNQYIFGINNIEFNKIGIVNNLVIEGERIKLKLLTPEFAAEITNYYIRNKEHLEKVEPQRAGDFYTQDVQAKILMDDYTLYLNGTNISMGIFKDDKFIGKISCSNIINGVLRSAIIGYSIDKESQGKGYATEAVRLISDYCYKKRNIHRLEASTIVDNYKSQNVLKKNGFKELGKNEKYLYIGGSWRDHITYYKILEG